MSAMTFRELLGLVCMTDSRKCLGVQTCSGVHSSLPQRALRNPYFSGPEQKGQELGEFEFAVTLTFLLCTHRLKSSVAVRRCGPGF